MAQPTAPSPLAPAIAAPQDFVGAEQGATLRVLMFQGSPTAAVTSSAVTARTG
ncbi:hypothetical protein [Streptomyces sp. NPDC056361]|uniref:hypothetical protein n=1 Tax=Streptomyces sp. NPDC056361 TaxID=3345795 RepID=UPI0035DF8ADC